MLPKYCAHKIPGFDSMYKCRDIERTVFNGRLSLIYTVDKFAFMVLKFCSCCRCFLHMQRRLNVCFNRGRFFFQIKYVVTLFFANIQPIEI